MKTPTWQRPEILAPAGTQEAFAAALAVGADAVYLGLAEGFNARGRSTAFDLDGLPELVARAHAANVKLYLTLNTLIFEQELAELEGVLRRAITAGVDALIVQDPATAFLAQRLSPKIRLHASTQMTISSVEGARFAATLGVDRVVLPRELSTKEIALFTRECPLESEVFVHGALCMSWSGQCLTSEAFSNRSANRGQCSQACRMPYEAVVDGELRELGDLRYLLSPQDLAAHDALPELLDAGVQSLKIEGRYKGPAYVTTAVESWKNWRDALLRGATEQDRTRLERDVLRSQLTYSRGGTVGFLSGDNHQTLVVATTPQHRGVELGVVRRVQGRQVTVALTEGSPPRETLRAGLGIKFELVGRSAQAHDPDNAPGGPLFAVQVHPDGLADFTFGQPGPDLRRVRVGDLVRLTGDPDIARETERRLAHPPDGRIPVTLRVWGQAQAPLSAEMQARLAHQTLTAHAQTPAPLQRAHGGSGLDHILIGDKLAALGGTPFHVEQIDTQDLAQGLHLPVSALKTLRRQLVSQLEQQLTTSAATALPEQPVLPALLSSLSISNTESLGPPQLIPLCRTQEQLEAVIESNLGPQAEVELDWMEMVGLRRAVERARSAGLRVTLATVRVQKPGEEAYDRRVAALAPDGVLVRHWGALMHFASAAVGASKGTPPLLVHGDFSLNVTNSITAHHLLALGLDTVTASHDLNRTQLLDLLGGLPRGRVALTLYHHIPTFHNSHCVYAHLLSTGADYRTCGRPCEQHRLSLRDYAGHEHPVVVDVSCRNTVFNAFAQSAAPLVPRLLELGVRRFRVELVWESAEDTKRALSAYQRLLQGDLSPTAALEAAAVHERYGVTTPLRIGKR